MRSLAPGLFVLILSPLGSQSRLRCQRPVGGPRKSMKNLFSSCLLAVAGLSGSPDDARAQGAAGSDTREPVCLGFSFGPWNPPLRWKDAGHETAVDTALVPRAPQGRGWAATGTASGDTTLVLFPPWWPVGVVVDLPTARLAAGDTVTGRASALVADGRRKAPVSRVRAWRVPCRAPGPG